MKMKLLITSLFASLMMAGSALAMDSATIEKHMAKINENYVQTAEEKGEVEALEEMIQMMLDEQDA